MPGKNVLVVDDEGAVRALTAALLQRLGHSSQSAATGADALRLLETTRFDLVITDLYMPGLRGDELAQEITKRRPGLPILLITGTRLDRDPPGFVGVLNKPFTLSELRAIVERALASGSNA